jgi:hemolysin III
MQKEMAEVHAPDPTHVDADVAHLSLEQRPLLRGRLHQIAAIVSAFGLGSLVYVAPTPQAKVAAWIYGLSAVLLYLTSTTYHVFTRSPRMRLVMQRVDHSMIYVLIAGTFTPICMLAMEGWFRWAILGFVWLGALTGVGLTVLAGHRYPRFGFGLYLALGWAGVAAFPTLVEDPARLFLMVTAGVLYTVGAVMFALHWPFPNAKWFGYHEVWHVFVVAAGVLFFIVNFGIIRQG